ARRRALARSRVRRAGRDAAQRLGATTRLSAKLVRRQATARSLAGATHPSASRHIAQASDAAAWTRYDNATSIEQPGHRGSEARGTSAPQPELPAVPEIPPGS